MSCLFPWKPGEKSAHHVKVEIYKETAACKASYRPLHFGMPSNMEIALELAGESLGGRGTIHACVHAREATCTAGADSSFLENQRETDSDMLRPDTILFYYGSRKCTVSSFFGN